jgi:hypothetical protein
MGRRKRFAATIAALAASTTGVMSMGMGTAHAAVPVTAADVAPPVVSAVCPAELGGLLTGLTNDVLGTALGIVPVIGTMVNQLLGGILGGLGTDLATLPVIGSGELPVLGPFVDGLLGAVTGLPLLDGLVGGTGCGTP